MRPPSGTRPALAWRLRRWAQQDPRHGLVGAARGVACGGSQSSAHQRAQQGARRGAAAHGAAPGAGCTGAVEHWGSQGTTAVSLQDLRDIGLSRRRRMAFGVELHRELRIRFAQRVLELRSLPYNLGERPGVRDVIGWYTQFVEDLDNEEVPSSPEGDQRFTEKLREIFEEHTEVIQAMAFGVQHLMAELGPGYSEVQPQVDAILRRFFMARIGLRFLLQHHIESSSNREGHSGILQLECNPAELCRKAGRDSAALCRAVKGQAPHIVVHDDTPGTFTYVPMHLNYMLTEVFKNACRATVEQHAEGFDDPLPPVHCRIVHGHEDITIKISDEGGGISRASMQDVWKFMYSTYKKSPWGSLFQKSSRPSSADSASNPLQRQRAGGVLAGYGVGLTLSRLYAQYFGGDLKILSMHGFGTDVYLHLPRLGKSCENLPKVVMYSPSMRDSSLSDNAAEPERLLISADEEAFLRERLAAFRRKPDEDSGSFPFLGSTRD
ncbi:unnamed protein product [Prorocentrum cordatum]|nr:unnamed protein product [Polarella glacialis]